MTTTGWNHFIGIDYYRDRVYQNDIEKEALYIEFNYCPECGEKLNETI